MLSFFCPLTDRAAPSNSANRVENSGQDEIELPGFLRRQAD
jgi:hypothetical protein